MSFEGDPECPCASCHARDRGVADGKPTPTEKADVVAFMKSLIDPEFAAVVDGAQAP
ncbi:hypothetical protein [Sorangium sp. So ce381]|uniref:hypothetical protein n=1 Tax=Sorangium sp. So ce381 TaxID=3133307 RepID=UPI003F5B9CC8